MNEILARREQLGLRFSLIFNLVMLLFFVGVTLASAQSVFETVVTLAIVGVSGVVVAFFLAMNFQGRFIAASGWTVTALYTLVILALPWIWYESVGGAEVPRTYFLKVAILPMCFIVLLLSCLPGRAVYPLVFTVGSSLGLVALLVAGLSDPRTLLTDNILDSVQGPGANLNLLLMNDVVYAVTGGLATVVVHRFRQTVLEASAAEHSTAQLGRYFSPGLVSLIARSDSRFLKPGGQLQTVTVLFSDLRDFTALAEGRSPSQVVELLSAYQEEMVAAIFEQGGTLDKFIGDGIMATFGTPHPQPDDAHRAVRAALDMQQRLVALNDRLEARGLPRLRQGIGLHSGPVIAGNVGTAARLEYTVIGDVVNTASRIEALCKQTGDFLLVSDEIVRLTGGQFSFVSRGTLPLRGKAAPLEVYTVTTP